jgi:hypothetical protein
LLAAVQRCGENTLQKNTIFTEYKVEFYIPHLVYLMTDKAV